MVNFYAWLLATILLFFNPGNFSDKNFLVGDYLGYQGNYIYLKNAEGINKYPYNEKTLLALKGPQKGRLLSLDDFPQKIPVLIIFKAGQIQMMSNLPQNLKYKPGTKLPVQGFTASLNPRETAYTVFGEKGLHLYYFNSKEGLYLSEKQPSAWDNLGTKIAFTTSQGIGIYHLDKKEKTTHLFPEKKPELIRVVFHLEWSPNNEQLLVSFLEDYPQKGSELFQIKVLSNKKTKEIIIPNLGPVNWLSENEIIIVSNPGLETNGKIIIWNHHTGEKKIISELEQTCTNLVYNPQLDLWAFTLQKKNGMEELYLYSAPQSRLFQLKTLLFPSFHLQWTKNNLLVFWSEVDNSLSFLDCSGQKLAQFKGYLPLEAVSEHFLYFPEEPLDEPLPLYLSTCLDLEMFN